MISSAEVSISPGTVIASEFAVALRRSAATRESAARATDVCCGSLAAQAANSMAETHRKPELRIAHPLQGVGISPPAAATERCALPRHVVAQPQTPHTSTPHCGYRPVPCIAES